LIGKGLEYSEGIVNRLNKQPSVDESKGKDQSEQGNFG